MAKDEKIITFKISKKALQVFSDATAVGHKLEYQLAKLVKILEKREDKRTVRVKAL